MKKEFVLKIASWLVTITATIYMVYRIITYQQYDQLMLLLAGLDWLKVSVFATTICLIPVQLLIEAIRWQQLVRPLTFPTLAQAFGQVLYGYVGAFITPYRLGEFPARLLKAGIDHEAWQLQKSNWRAWLRDLNKWGKVVMLTLMRYMVWMIQLWGMLYVCAVPLTTLQALCSIPLYYLIVSIAPSLPAADVAIKGGWATLVFGQLTDNIPGIALAVIGIWLINTVLPTLVGLIQDVRVKMA
ncbi:MAG: hypothetical protein MJZ88_03105 [Paludibacteraceae bacterium]|nr:hypothetical protein [Paludibacteraceae bacterium]